VTAFSLILHNGLDFVEAKIGKDEVLVNYDKKKLKLPRQEAAKACFLAPGCFYRLIFWTKQLSFRSILPGMRFRFTVRLSGRKDRFRMGTNEVWQEDYL